MKLPLAPFLCWPTNWSSVRIQIRMIVYGEEFVSWERAMSQFFWDSLRVCAGCRVLYTVQYRQLVCNQIWLLIATIVLPDPYCTLTHTLKIARLMTAHRQISCFVYILHDVGVWTSYTDSKIQFNAVIIALFQFKQISRTPGFTTHFCHCKKLIRDRYFSLENKFLCQLF